MRKPSWTKLNQVDCSINLLEISEAEYPIKELKNGSMSIIQGFIGTYKGWNLDFISADSINNVNLAKLRLFSCSYFLLSQLTEFLALKCYSLMWLNLRPSVTVLCGSTPDQVLQFNMVQAITKWHSRMWYPHILVLKSRALLRYSWLVRKQLSTPLTRCSYQIPYRVACLVHHYYRDYFK